MLISLAAIVAIIGAAAGLVWSVLAIQARAWPRLAIAVASACVSFTAGYALTATWSLPICMAGP